MRLHYLIALLLFFTGITLYSCSETDCSLMGKPQLLIRFYSTSNPTQKVTTDSLKVNALGTDSLLFKSKMVSSLSLVLRYDDEQTVYILAYTKDISDTIEVTHTNKPYFTSMECGQSMHHFIERVRHTQHGIDSIHIKNPVIDNNEKENLQFFYAVTKPSADH